MCTCRCITSWLELPTPPNVTTCMYRQIAHRFVQHHPSIHPSAHTYVGPHPLCTHKGMYMHYARKRFWCTTSTCTGWVYMNVAS
jgi:hypothetical protein